MNKIDSTLNKKKVLSFKRSDCSSKGIYILLFIILIIVCIMRYFFVGKL